MHQARDIYSLTDFKNNAKQHLDRLKETGRPEVLTVNGKAEAVIMTPETYDRMIDSSLEGVRRKVAEGLEQARSRQLIDGESSRIRRKQKRRSS